VHVPGADAPGSFEASSEAGRCHPGQQQGQRQRRAEKLRAQAENIQELESGVTAETVIRRSLKD
jgi:hypothetical protein